MRAPGRPSDPGDDVFDAIADPSVFDRLCETERTVLVQRYVERRTIDEIAVSLCVVPRVVEQRLTDALRSMRRALSDELTQLGREGLQS